MGLTACCELLQISERTLRNWESGSTRIPYAAYKLVRVLKGGKYLGPEWRDFHVWGGVLHTPEGHRFKFSDLAWWSLLSRRAHQFSELMKQAVPVADSERASEAAQAAGLVSSATSRMPLGESLAVLSSQSDRLCPGDSELPAVRVEEPELPAGRGEAAGRSINKSTGSNSRPKRPLPVRQREEIQVLPRQRLIDVVGGAL